MSALAFSMSGCRDQIIPDNDDGDDNDYYGIIYDINEIAAVLENREEGAEKENPVVLELNMDLGKMSSAGSGWQKLLSAIGAAQKFVTLDLSACTLEEHPSPYFHPDYTISTGKNKIVKLILPDDAADITGGTGAGDCAFKYFSALEYVKGKNINHIGSWAFYDCGNLEKIDFPAVTAINQGVFYGCDSLIEADLINVVYIGNNAFSGCSNLVSVNMPKAETIDQYAFYNCTSLVEAVFLSVKTIGNCAFYGCNSLEKALFPKVEIVHAQTFSGCTHLEEIDFSSATYIATEAFYGCSSLEKAVFPKVTVIESNVFLNCTSLTEASFPDAFYIAAYSFGNCINLKKAEFHADVSQITFEPFALYGCSSLETLDLRYAKNVAFHTGVLGNIGNTQARELNLYLFDDDGTLCNGGHPPLGHFMGGADGGIQTVITINIIAPFVPQGQSQIEKINYETHKHGIYISLTEDSNFNKYIKTNPVIRRNDL